MQVHCSVPRERNILKGNANALLWNLRDADNLHVVQNIMSMDNMAWEGFNFLLQAGNAMQGDGGYGAAGGAGGLVGLYDAFSNSGAWDGSWRTGEGNEAGDGEWES